MNFLRTGLHVMLVVMVILVFRAWDQDHPAPAHVSTSALPTATQGISFSPDFHDTAGRPIPPAPALPVTEKNTSSAAVLSNRNITVSTDVLVATIDTVGGGITGLSLLNHTQDLDNPAPVQLLNDLPATRYIAQAGLFGKNGPDTAENLAHWIPEKTRYTLKPGEDTLFVKMHWQTADGVKFTRVLTFHRSSYAVSVSHTIENTSAKPWSGNAWLELSRKNTPPENQQGFAGTTAWFGAAISSPEKAYQKISFRDMDRNPLNKNIENGWLAMIQHYFVSALVPEPGQSFQYFTQKSTDGLYTLGALGPLLTAAPHQTVHTTATLYSGPAIADQMKTVSATLPLTIDYGWFWMISEAIFWLMQAIYRVVGNWGWSIVIVTLLIKLAFYPLSAKSCRSMSALRHLQPKLAALKERFGDDRKKLTEATLELYRTEKVNPMSGCLPVLIQIPVFIALYWVLVESIQLRHAPFVLWIRDLSAMDPWYVLPLFMGVSMFLQQRLNPPPQDPTQAKVMMMMPVVFTVLFARFPAGLMLYWFVNNTLSFLQQWYIMRTCDVEKNTIKKYRK